jgi:hypothetical protein
LGFNSPKTHHKKPEVRGGVQLRFGRYSRLGYRGGGHDVPKKNLVLGFNSPKTKHKKLVVGMSFLVSVLSKNRIYMQKNKKWKQK